MKITEETIDKIANLARLEVSAEEKHELKADMTRILDFMDKLNEVDTADVEPLVYMTGEVNVLRADEVKQLVTHEEALLNAPAKTADYFKVAKVLNKKEHGTGSQPKSEDSL
ncbi:Asp-tRNA(Asn)/Glu-tRNA(Gln) amidotransferase subunit GatC [Mucilaginibacter sp. RS28]|uniref:Aspartyl/glutamyl-tRNA(Asn/Gln) amidotransferase subunit C n=1 Tax=Mucilaginibacter straminoryzae TaxID=2932774 RepID=A0A9X1X734_9SPHI|nr:Asp-tRNA(Asn)/Glu-tRNA(Gln) amidotransferase subunit GatC [Mucilaginibacter straminoryzae]MCJ8210898.1 Asp-tRNA(Asn)/Glu-tRNA(Gln) amidotransferase subunit GatC [Mucilaginibacter straminoryzae]